MTLNEKLRERCKLKINVLFQLTWILVALVGLGIALFHLLWVVAVPLIILSFIIGLQMWGQWDEPGGCD